MPWREADFRALVDYLEALSAAEGTDWFTAVEADQTAALATYLWQGCQRGGEAGRLTLQDHTNRWAFFLLGS